MPEAQPHRRPNRSPAGRGKGGSEATRVTTTAAPTTSASPPEPGRERGPRPLHQRLRRWSLLLSFGCGLVLGYGLAGPLPRLLAPVMASLQRATPGFQSLVPALGLSDHRRILVLGSDQISGNTDVIFTVQLKDGTTQLTQVPRDTFIESERYGVLKANALYATGGVDAVKQELTTLLAAPVDRYVLVNLDAVQRLAEAIGGVEVDVPKRMYYTDSRQNLYIDLYPGRQLLKGRELEGFLRFRHDELGDIGRMERQKLVLREVFHKLAQPGMVTRLPGLLQIAGSDIRTDLSPVELASLVTALSSTKLSTDRLAGRLFWRDDLSYWMPDLNTRHAGEENPEPSP